MAAHFGTFCVTRASKLATTFGNEYLSYEEQTTYYLRTSKSSLEENTVAEKLDRIPEVEKKGAGEMATYRDPVRCFAPLEVIERLLEIRVEAGYTPAVYLLSPDDLADYLDAYGFDVYALSEAEAEFHFGDYRAPLAPGGDHAHCSLTAH
ncbi:MAG TPA: hypothetical protein VKG87_04980 [Terriglobales bacterium]|nr:hypothetical protein [Terriglobales bacterium]